MTAGVDHLAGQPGRRLLALTVIGRLTAATVAVVAGLTPPISMCEAIGGTSQTNLFRRQEGDKT